VEKTIGIRGSGRRKLLMITPQTANSRIRTVTYWGLVGNISLSALKVIVGVWLNQ
jgi:hypothetical protein